MEPVDERALQHELRTSRGTQAVTELLAIHPELRGVHAPADFVADAVRWSA